MKAASSEWYGTTPRLPVLHPTTSSSSSLSRHQKSSFHSGYSPSSSRYEGSFSLTSGYSFSTSTGSTSNNTENTSSHNTNSTDNHSNHSNRNRPQRQLSKVLTPTITTSSSTSFSKSYSRGSRSRSNSTTEPTATTSTSTSQYTTNSISEATTSDTNSRTTGGGGNRPPYSFSPDANKYKRSFSSQRSSSSNKGRLFPGSSGDTFTRGSSNASSLLPSTSFPPIISESEISETEVAFTDEEGDDDEEEDEETESGYDNTPEMPTDEASAMEEEDPVYQSFKNSLRMLRVPDDRINRNVRVISPAISMRSVITEVEEDEEDLPPDSVDDEATSCTEGEEDDDGEEMSSTSSYRDRTRYLRSRSGSVPKTPVKVRVKVEKAVPQTYFDDRVKVTVQVEEETEASEMDDEYDEDEREEEDETEEEEEEDEENSVTESDATSTNTADTVRYLSRRDINGILGGGKSQVESSSESGSEINSETEEESEGATTSSYDKTDYPQPRRTPLFPPINGVYRDKSSEIGSINRLSTMSKSTSQKSSMSIHDVLHQLSSNSSTETTTESVRKSETSMDSTGTEVSGSTNSEATTTGTRSSATATTSGSGTATGTTGSSPSETSSRSQSARSSLRGRASAIHKMYSVGGKVRSLSARRSIAQQRQNTYTVQSPHLPNSVPRLLSTESTSPSITSKTSSSSETSGSKQYLPGHHLGPPHSRSLSASSKKSRGPFSAALRQLSLDNIQAMNPQYPRGAAGVLAEKAFKGESLPPISPSSASSASSLTSPIPYKSKLPRPLVRNLTYTVRNHSTEDSDNTTTTSNNLPEITPPPQHSTEHITLRQLIMSDRSSSESTTAGPSDEKTRENPENVHDVLFPSNLIPKTEEAKKDPLKPSQVSFAATVIEHSLSSSHTLESASTPSEQTGSASPQRSDSAESSSESSYITCRLTGRRMKKLTAEEEDELLNRDYLTFRDLQQESIDEPDTSKDRLRHFALDTIRKQMEMERKRIESTEHDDEVFSTDYDFSDEDETGSSVYSSEEEGSEEEKTPKPGDKEISQIPVMAASDALPVEGSGDKASDGQESTSTEPAAGEVPEKGEGEPQDIIINPSDEASSSFKEDLKKNFEDGEEQQEPAVLSMAGTRINSAESGYRAMPPSRACSTREASLEPEEVEKEKERIMQQWKDSGGVGAPPAITTSVTSNSSHMFVGGELITINYSRPNTASDSANNALIQGGIDLTQELPGEEKKIAAVWEEFNRDEREGGAMADYEFSTLLDEMIMDVNSYKPKLSTTGLISNSQSSQSQSLQVSNQVTYQHICT